MKAARWATTIATAAALALASGLASAPARASVNPAFNLGSGFNAYTGAIVVQGDGKVLVGGGGDQYKGSPVSHGLVRLNTDGSVDTAFTSHLGTGFDDSVIGIAVQGDGKILVTGYFTTLNSADVPDAMVRLNPDGTLDTAFNAQLGSGFDNGVEPVVVMGDGSILVGGAFTALNSTDVPDNLVRLNSDGTLATAFNTNLGGGFDGGVWSLARQTSGAILVAGAFHNLNASDVPDALVRLNDDGTLNSAFNAQLGTGFNDAALSVATKTDGSVLVGGKFTGKLVRLNANGTRNTVFNANLGSGFDDRVSVVQFDSVGKALVGGYFTTLNGADVPDKFLRLGAAGTPDVAYNRTLGSGFDRTVYAVAEQGDTALLVAGDFTTLDGAPVSHNLASLLTATRPSAPRNVAPASRNASTRVSWAAPVSSNGTITGYTATARATGQPTRSCTTTGAVTRACTITGLVNSVKYAVRVIARNDNGPGALSSVAYVTPRIPIYPSYTKAGRVITARFTAPTGPVRFTLGSTGATTRTVACARVGTTLPKKYACSITLKPGTSKLRVTGLSSTGAAIGMSTLATKTVA